MKRLLFILTLMIIVLTLFTSLYAHPEVTNLRAVQRNDAGKKVDIYYNIQHDIPVTITIQASADNGQTWDLSCRLVTGDVGENISPGRGKHIVWDVLTEHPNISGDEFRFKVHANDRTVPPPPEGMVLVEGGTFNPATNYTVTLSSFYISKYEVTQSEYLALMGINPSNFGGFPDRPVENVSWFKAIEFCNRLSMQEGLNPCYRYGNFGANPDNWPVGWNSSWQNHIHLFCDWRANGYRLPTEMEWEYAARGGLVGQIAETFNTRYSGSNNINGVAWYRNNSGNRTQNVGIKAQNELGLYDMTGNVWEWCWDVRGDYPTGQHIDPRGSDNGVNRMVRGGGWHTIENNSTVFYRGDVGNELFNLHIGFRVVRSSN